MLNTGAILQTGGDILLAAGGDFHNDSGTDDALNSERRWLVWSTRPDQNREDIEMNGRDFLQYNAVYTRDGDLSGYDGNGLLYSVAPVLAVEDQTRTYGDALGNATFNMKIGETAVDAAKFGLAAETLGLRMVGEPERSSSGYFIAGTHRDAVQADATPGISGLTFETADLMITKRALAMRAMAADRVYDGTALATVALSDDRVTGDALNYGATARFSDKTAGADKAVTAELGPLGGADAGNYVYAAELLHSTADIARRQLLVSAAAADKIYDGGVLAMITDMHDNRVEGDSLSYHVEKAGFADKNVGADKGVTAQLSLLSGIDAGNYILAPEPPETMASITPKTLDVHVTAADKTYDGTVATMVAMRDDRIAGDMLTIEAKAEFESAAAGADRPVTIRLLGLSGTDGGNYRFSRTILTTSADIEILATRDIPVLIPGGSSIGLITAGDFPVPITDYSTGQVLFYTLRLNSDLPDISGGQVELDVPDRQLRCHLTGQCS